MPTKIDQADVDWLVSHLPDGSQQETDWFKIDAKGNKKREATVYIMDEITSWGTGARAFAEQVASLDVDTIELHLNSPGGNFAEGVAIMNMLRDHKATVTAHIDGLAASAATIVAMGADRIIAKAGSQMMVHEGSGLVYGPMRDMLKMATVLEKSNAAMASIYADRAGGTSDEWRAAMAAETWYNAQEAVDAGLADSLDASGKEDEVVAACNRFDLTVFAHAGRGKAPDPYKPTAEPPNEEEGNEMPNEFLVQDATDLGIKDPDKFADDKSLHAAIVEARAKGNKPDDKPDDTPGEDGDRKVTSTNIPEGFALVDKQTITALQEGQHRADALVAQIEAERRDTALDAAVAAGKIPVARREFWVKFWKSDPEGAKAALAELPDNLVPVAPIGSGGSDADEFDADYRALYPNEVS